MKSKGLFFVVGLPVGPTPKQSLSPHIEKTAPMLL